MSASNFITKKRNVDIVFCIDGTGSMSACIENVKQNAKRFYSDLIAELIASGSQIDMLRVKTIVFRDYKSDGDASMQQSAFFELPGDTASFERHLTDIVATGGCGEDANGLEALYYAMNSDFTSGLKDRQVIVLFADTTAIPLKKRAKYQNYPSSMVDEKGLFELWTGSCTQFVKLKENCKRLVMFAPEKSIYNDIDKKYNNSCFYPVEMGGGLGEIDFKSIVRIIAASIS